MIPLTFCKNLKCQGSQRPRLKSTFGVTQRPWHMIGPRNRPTAIDELASNTTQRAASSPPTGRPFPTFLRLSLLSISLSQACPTVLEDRAEEHGKVDGATMDHQAKHLEGGHSGVCTFPSSSASAEQPAKASSLQTMTGVVGGNLRALSASSRVLLNRHVAVDASEDDDAVSSASVTMIKRTISDHVRLCLAHHSYATTLGGTVTCHHGGHGCVARHQNVAVPSRNGRWRVRESQKTSRRKSRSIGPQDLTP